MSNPPPASRPRSQRLAFAAALAFALLIAPHARGDSMIAIVTATRGDVSIQGGTSSKAATLMQPLFQGMVIRAGDGATATLGFVLGGVRVHLQGPCQVEVIPAGVRIVQGTPAQVTRTEPPARTALRVPPKNSSLDRMGAVHLRASPAEEIAWVGVNHAHLAPPASLSWRPPPALKWKGFKLTIWHESGAELTSVTSPGTACTALLPTTVHLESGRGYQLEVEGVTVDGRKVTSPAHTFWVLSADEAKEIRRAQDEAEHELLQNPTDATPLAILLTVLNAAELTRESLDVAERLEKLQDTPSPALATWIQHLRRKLGVQ